MSEMYVSAVLGRPVIDSSGAAMGHLADLGLEPGEVMPAVSGLYVRRGKTERYLPWRSVNLFTPVVVSADPEAVEAPSSAAADVRLKRDVLDRQIVDVDGAKVVRVNDLNCATSAKLRVESVTGPGGMAAGSGSSASGTGWPSSLVRACRAGRSTGGSWRPWTRTPIASP